MASLSNREYDLILLGATGYTGRKTAEYIAKHFPADLAWAIFGRLLSKPTALKANIFKLFPDCAAPEIEIAEHSGDALHALVHKTKVLFSTVGPYHHHGTPILGACANAGTHYIDNCGETPRVYDVAHRYRNIAFENKVILMTQCAIESTPVDLAAYELARFVRGNFEARIAEMVHSIQEFNKAASSETLHSLIGVAKSYSLRHLRDSMQPSALCADAIPATKPSTPRSFSLFGSHRLPEIGLPSDSVLGMPDMTLVYRSWSLMDGDNYYGLHFQYFPGQKTANRAAGFLWHAGMTMLMLPPVRWLPNSVIPFPGEGPSEE